jgi:hypothetical protein
MIKRWVPLLTPGYFGGLTHGLIRTAYAVRSFPEHDKPSARQMDELAHGLAYWAGSWNELPGNPDRHGTLEVEEALSGPRVKSEGDAATATKGPQALTEFQGFSAKVESVRKAVDAGEAITRLRRLSPAFCSLIPSHGGAADPLHHGAGRDARAAAVFQ